MLIYESPPAIVSVESPPKNCEGIETPYGLATQSMTPAAAAIVEQARNGMHLFKGGCFATSRMEDSQFWSTRTVMRPDAAQKLGIPVENSEFQFVIRGRLKDGASFIVRPAPGIGANYGGEHEVVTNPGDVIITGFFMP